MQKILVVLGSTSTGKTDLALNLAEKFNGELIACDSRQVYKDLDIGTGKLPGELKIENLKLKIEKGNGWWQINGGKIWLYDVVDTKKQYTVYDYVKDAAKIIKQILKRGKLPIIVGGTGLYIKALIGGLPNLAIPKDEKLRKQLNNLTIKQLQQKLRKQDISRWNNLNESDRQNPRRLVRAIEISLAKPQRKLSKKRSKNFNVLKIGLDAPREILYKRIDERVINRINQGMIFEAEKLHKKGLSFKRMRQLGLEYGVLADYLQGKIKNKYELIKILQGQIHRFARRQLTWFKKEKDVFWFDITQSGWSVQVENKVSSWYYAGDDQTH